MKAKTESDLVPIDKYKTLNRATAEDKLQFDAIRHIDTLRPRLHITPPHGLLNDPNGFCYFNQTYHLFYQWFPFDTFHGMKHWMHVTSTDLYQWQEQGCKITPTEAYESHGAYSGAALVENDQAYLFYTGNIKSGSEPDAAREASQCMARLGADNQVQKHGQNPLIPAVPDGYTGHVRDPKVVKVDGGYYMLLGAQRAADLSGTIVVYFSEDLLDWTFNGELTIADQASVLRPIQTAFSQAYMFECPDFLQVDGYDVLIFSPQGMEKDGHRFHNRYHVVYCTGVMDWDSLTFSVGHWDELDRGFDFYAPQTMANAPDHPTLMAWAGTDEDLPSAQYGWINCLTAPRTLRVENGRLCQRLVNVDRYVTETVTKTVTDTETQPLDSLSFLLDVDCHTLQGRMTLALVDADDRQLVLTVDNTTQTVTLDRLEYAHHEADWTFGHVRSTVLERPCDQVLIMCDQSILEVFINDGEAVFTALFFPQADAHHLSVNMESDVVADMAITLNLHYLHQSC